MIKVDLIKEVSQAAGLTQSKASEAVEVILEELKAGMLGPGRIEIRGFGVFVVKPRKLGVGRNPKTGARVKILPGRTVRFRAGKELHNLTPDGEGG